MDADIVGRMMAEEADLVRKLDAVRQFLAVYGGATARATQQIGSAPRGKEGRHPAARERIGLDGYGSYGREVVRAAIKFIGHRVEPVQTRAIVDALQASGVEIRGNDPVNALSALLARSADVQSHGRRGWTLAKPDDFEELLAGDKPAEGIEPPNGIPVDGSQTALDAQPEEAPEW